MRYYAVTIIFVNILEKAGHPHVEHEQYCSCAHEPDEEHIKSIFHSLDDFTEKKYVGYRLREVTEEEFNKQENTVSFP